jgi:hypothetical protein
MENNMYKSIVANAVTAEELLTNIAKFVKEQVELFNRHLEREKARDFYEKQSEFVRRMMFFDNTYYHMVQNLRKVVNDWILYGKVDLYNYEKKAITPGEEAENRCEEIGEQISFYDNDCLEEMNKIRSEIIKQNPILSNPLISKATRNIVLNQALRADKHYSYYHKEFEMLVKKAVADIITYSLGFSVWGGEKMEKLVKKA